MSQSETKVAQPYTPAYQEACFQAFYAAGRPPKATQIIDVIPEDEYGRKPNADRIIKWRDELGWDWRADELDARVASQSDDILVTAKVTMLKEHAARARAIQVRAYDHILEKGFDTTASAVSALIKGAELERESRGMEVMLQKIAKMSDAEILEQIKKVSSGLSEEQMKTLVDAEVKDVTESDGDQAEE